MFNIIYPLKVYFKTHDFVIDNAIFRIHCTFTGILLVIFSIILTCNEYIGDPIKCFFKNEGSSDPVVQRYINTFCWITSTFTVEDAFRRPVGSGVAHPGIANDGRNPELRKFYKYYQFVCFALFFQALLCFFPKYLWKNCESGRLKAIANGLQIPVSNQYDRKYRQKILETYFISHLNTHGKYAFQYWFCEFLCFLNVFFQLYFMNWFFSGDFANFGFDVLNFTEIDQELRYDHMIYVFPRVTKCTIRKFGPSGTIEERDALCILPLNIVNEKIYIFLWFWFIILLALTSIVVLIRIISITCLYVRVKLIHCKTEGLDHKIVKNLCENISASDWWIIYMLRSNIDHIYYSEIIQIISKGLQKHKLKNNNKKNVQKH